VFHGGGGFVVVIVVIVAGNGARLDGGETEVDRGGRRHDHGTVGGAIEVDERELPADQIAFGHFENAGDAVRPRGGNLLIRRVDGGDRAQLRIEQADFLVIRTQPRGLFFEPQGGGGIDHAGIDVLAFDVDDGGAFRRCEILADADDLAVAHEYGALFDHGA